MGGSVGDRALSKGYVQRPDFFRQTVGVRVPFFLRRRLLISTAAISLVYDEFLSRGLPFRAQLAKM